MIAISIIGMILVVLVRPQQPAVAILLLFLLTMLLFGFLFHRMHELFAAVQSLVERFHLPNLYIETILKMISISYLVEWTSHMMKDAGLSTIALKIELAGKWMILFLAIPIINVLLEIILQIFPRS
jgi:stage III sporulation protein AD